jgi:deoxyadenosine/deoxycytidine kinase
MEDFAEHDVSLVEPSRKLKKKLTSLFTGIIFVSGPPAIGKSTLCQSLTSRYNNVLYIEDIVDNDKRKELYNGIQSGEIREDYNVFIAKQRLDVLKSIILTGDLKNNLVIIERGPADIYAFAKNTEELEKSKSILLLEKIYLVGIQYFRLFLHPKTTDFLKERVEKRTLGEIETQYVDFITDGYKQMKWFCERSKEYPSVSLEIESTTKKNDISKILDKFIGNEELSKMYYMTFLIRESFANSLEGLSMLESRNLGDFICETEVKRLTEVIEYLTSYMDAMF